jgi:uncharacterized membrane protein
MPENNKGPVKRFLPAILLASTFYYSFLVTLGLVIGYLGAKLYCTVLNIDENSDRRIFIDCGKWKIHFHHWIMGIVVLLIVWIVDYFYLPRFFIGVVGGVMAHDIYDYNDWHKVIVPNEEYQTEKQIG